MCFLENDSMSSDGFVETHHRLVSPISDDGTHSGGVPRHKQPPEITSSRMSRSPRLDDLRPPPAHSERLRRHHAAMASGAGDRASESTGFGRSTSVRSPANDSPRAPFDGRRASWHATEGFESPSRSVSPLSMNVPPPPGRPHSRTLHSPTPTRPASSLHNFLDDDFPGVDSTAPGRASDDRPTYRTSATPFRPRDVSPSDAPFGLWQDMARDDELPPSGRFDANRPPPMQHTDTSRSSSTSRDDWDRQSNSSHSANGTDRTDYDDRDPFQNGRSPFPGMQPPRTSGMNRARDPFSSRFRPWQNIMQGGFSAGSMLAETFINALQSFLQVILKWSESLVSLTRH
jgi:hypothetical protein